MSVFVLFALLASCAASSAPVGEHGKKVETFSRFLEEADKKVCCNCACGTGGQCGTACSSCDCDGCCGEEAEDEKSASSAVEPESEAEEHESEEEDGRSVGGVVVASFLLMRQVCL